MKKIDVQIFVPLAGNISIKVFSKTVYTRHAICSWAEKKNWVVNVTVDQILGWVDIEICPTVTSEERGKIVQVIETLWQGEEEIDLT